MARAKWLCCASLLVSSLASAQAAPAVMPFPLELKRAPPGFTKEDREALQREYTRLLRVAGARTPDFARYDFALSDLKRQDCEREDECLVQLAKKAESLYALYASLDFTLEGAVWATGRVVRDDGKVASPTLVVKVKEGAFKDDAQKALTELFAELKIAALPATRPVATSEPVRPVALVPSIATKPEPGGEGQRTAGRVMLLGGALVAVAGGSLLLSSQVIGGGLQPDALGNLPPEQVPAFKSAQTLGTAGLVGLATGGAVAVVGAMIWGLAPGPVSVSALAAPGEAMISVRGTF